MATYNAINNFTSTLATTTPTVTSGLTFDGTNIIETYVGATSYTPAITFGGGNTGLKYNSRTGYYVVIGDICYVSIRINVLNKGSSTGALRISLPIVEAVSTWMGSCMIRYITNSTFQWVMPRSDGTYSGLMQLGLTKTSTSTNTTAVDDADLATSFEVIATVFYWV